MGDIITHGDLNKWERSGELSSEEVIRNLKKIYGQKPSVIQTKTATA